jgi:lysophospholipase L1-like esterase
VDATPWFQGDASRFLAYDRHPNARGHAAMAQALAEADRRLRERGQP